MSDTIGANRRARREWHGVHQPWAYRAEAFRWLGGEIVGINFLPLAQQMRAWLQQRGQLHVASTADQKAEGGYTNPYTFNGVALSLIMGRVVNSFYDYINGQTSDHDEVDAEIERLRLYNEVVLYSVRICEASIKQLLYCTQVPESRYKLMALGGLLESPCPSCRKQNGRKPHQVSLVGSLAHPFHLCLEFEHCAMDHMNLANRLRNSEAAHAGIQTLNITSVADSKAQLRKDCDEVLTGFLHLLSHVEKLEQSMLDNLAQTGEAIVLRKLTDQAPQDSSLLLVPGDGFRYRPKPRS
jgi:hypothetical protein